LRKRDFCNVRICSIGLASLISFSCVSTGRETPAVSGSVKPAFELATTPADGHEWGGIVYSPTTGRSWLLAHGDTQVITYDWVFLAPKSPGVHKVAMTFSSPFGAVIYDTVSGDTFFTSGGLQWKHLGEQDDKPIPPGDYEIQLVTYHAPEWAAIRLERQSGRTWFARGLWTAGQPPPIVDKSGPGVLVHRDWATWEEVRNSPPEAREEVGGSSQ